MAEDNYHALVDRPDIQAVKELCDSGVSPNNIKDARGVNILIKSIVSQNHSLFKTVMKYNPSVGCDMLEDGSIIEPFWEAIQRDEEQMAIELVEAGASVEFCTDKKHSLFHFIDRGMWNLFRKVVSFYDSEQINSFSFPLIHYIIPKMIEEKENHWGVIEKTFAHEDILFFLLDKGCDASVIYNGNYASELAQEAWKEVLADNQSHAAAALIITLEKSMFKHMASKNKKEKMQKVL